MTAFYRMAATAIFVAGLVGAIWLVRSTATLHEAVTHDPPREGGGTGLDPEELDLYIECKPNGPLVVQAPGGFAVVYNSTTWTPRSAEVQQLCDTVTDERRLIAAGIAGISLATATALLVYGRVRRRRQGHDSQLPDLSPTPLLPEDETLPGMGNRGAGDTHPRVPGLSR